MSRAGYSEDLDNWDLIRYRGRVASATKGKRGQKLLTELLAALDEMPVKELVADVLEEDGAVCALGALGKVRGVDVTKLDPEDAEEVGKAFDINECLAREIVYENDEGGPWRCTPAQRWIHMRNWVSAQIKSVPQPPIHGVHDGREK